MSSFVEFKNVGKIYHMGEVDIEALNDVNFVIDKGGNYAWWKVPPAPEKQQF